MPPPITRTMPSGRYEDLPILPEKWQYSVDADKKKQFDLLKKLMERSDVTEVCERL